MSDQSIHDGRCQWCNGGHEGGPIVKTSRGYWWHPDCAVDNEAELADAIELVAVVVPETPQP